MTSAAEDLRQRREAILTRLMALFPEIEGPQSVPQAETRQFLSGYLNMVEAGARGDLGPREDMLDMVVVGLKHSGLPLGDVLESVIAIGMALAVSVDPQHVPWHIQFNRDYVKRLVQKWQQS